MDKFRFTLETKHGISEDKAKTIWDYLKIVADQIGMLLRKEKVDER